MDDTAPPRPKHRPSEYRSHRARRRLDESFDFWRDRRLLTPELRAARDKQLSNPRRHGRRDA